MQFTNTRKDSPIISVEFSVIPEGNLSFFTLKNEPGNDKEKLKQWLTQEAGQQIIAETQMGKGNVLITRGSKSAEELLGGLEARGDQLEKPERKGKINFWKMRGWASMIGQPLSFISGVFQKGGADASTVAFASLNIAANISNIIFGGETKKDPHRLHFIKEDFNKKIGQYIENNAWPPGVNDSRAKLREEEKPEPPISTRVYNFMQRNSVRVGEIGLRYVGSLFMAFPLVTKARWQAFMGKIAEKDMKGAFYTASNTTPGKRNWNFIIGITYLTGKTIGFFSKIPDKYDPKPHTTLDTIREKVLFRLSTMIETVGASVIVYDRIKNKGVHFPKEGTTIFAKIVPSALRGKTWNHDWIGAVGGALFTGGFLMRFFAPFGQKHVNIKEIDAHITDGLAKVPQDKLPQLLADTVANAYPHIQKSGITYGQLFKELSDSLYSYHSIAALPPMRTDAEAATPVAETKPEKSHAKPEMKKSPARAAMAPTASYREKTLTSPESGAMPLGAS